MSGLKALPRQRQGGLKKRPRPVTQKLMRTGGSRCPVTLLEKLLSKRPPELELAGPLYLSPLRKQRDWSHVNVWFSRQPVGVNIINNFMKRMATQAGLDTTQKHFTNHSMRKTTVRSLKKTGVSSREIMAITGHRSEQSLADYDQLNIDDHRQLSHIISGNPPRAETPMYTPREPGPSYQPHAQFHPHLPSLYSLPSPPVISSLSFSQANAKKLRCIISDSDSD